MLSKGIVEKKHFIVQHKSFKLPNTQPRNTNILHEKEQAILFENIHLLLRKGEKDERGLSIF